jgi:hypothetical protein
MLNETWEKFEAEHEKLLTSKTDVSKDLEYFKNDAYQTTMHVYVSGKAQNSYRRPRINSPSSNWG